MKIAISEIAKAKLLMGELPKKITISLNLKDFQINKLAILIINY